MDVAETLSTKAAPSLVDVARRARQSLEASAAQHTHRVIVEYDGRVESNADGILHLSGLDEVGYGEVVYVAGQEALVMSLTERHAVAALLCGSEEARRVRVGDRARRSTEVLGISVSEALLGRVVDPLGRALDGVKLTTAGRSMPLERRAPQIFERAAVHEPLYTGMLVIDGMFPIGRGQRELIVGDEGTGKTTLALDAMLNQVDSDVVCVYAGIGQRRSETWRVRETLERRGVKFTIVCSPEDDSPAMRYLAPYAAAAIAEYHRDRGAHALVVYDDLSAHAVAFRELSLLLGRAPGREAYPGDIFYLHSRLLERAAQMSLECGGGSVTALPICSLESGRLTAYIPTNLVSITDGQLVLSSALFTAGQRPAIDAGVSVSRVGARAQSRLLSKLSGPLKIDYASFLELEAFARLGTRLEPEAERRVELGRRTRRLLHAQRGSPLSLLAELVRLALAKNADLLLRVPEDDVFTSAQNLVTMLEERHPDLGERIVTGTIVPERFMALVEAEAKRLLHG